MESEDNPKATSFLCDSLHIHTVRLKYAHLKGYNAIKFQCIIALSGQKSEMF